MTRSKNRREYVIDTNVLVVANRQPDKNGKSHSPDCEIKAIEFLDHVRETGILLLDDEGEIVNEYLRNLDPNRKPRQLGSGDQFYLSRIRRREHIREIELSRMNGEYEDLPQEIIDAGFHRHDRVFAALAKKKNAPVANAVDSDWLIHLELLKKHHIGVLFVCGEDEDCWH